jgi:hypothetical protein
MASVTVREAILKPMLEIYAAPPHLIDAQDRKRALAAYERVLSRFDRQTLKRAWEQVAAIHTAWTWPSPAFIQLTCQRLPRHPAPPSEEEQRRSRAIEMADDYARKFMKGSHVAELARKEGWAERLSSYVRSAAWVQAQIICGVREIGWDICLVPNWDSYGSAQAAFAAYRQTVAKCVERGQIRVNVPKDRIVEWKEQIPQGAAASPSRNGAVGRSNS